MTILISTVQALCIRTSQFIEGVLILKAEGYLRNVLLKIMIHKQLQYNFTQVTMNSSFSRARHYGSFNGHSNYDMPLPARSRYYGSNGVNQKVNKVLKSSYHF